MPNNNLVIPMFADRKWRIIRRHRMVKFKRRKRIDRDWFQYQKKHTKKKQKAEMIFRSRMNEILKELETFDPLTYIDETIERLVFPIRYRIIKTELVWSSKIKLGEQHQITPRVRP